MRYIIKGGVWKNSEDEILKAAVMKYGLNQWSRISSLLVRKSAKQCKARWYEWLDPSIKKTEWTREEEEKLLHLAKIFPCQWRTIAPIVGRTPAQCVEHYDKLLDQAQGKEEDDNDPRKLKPGEIDPTPETKPARPDPIDMDEDEKEMLAEARVRLANTKGKKAKRKAREKQIEEARRLASLQKKRELKAAGIDFVIKKKSNNKKMDYNVEVPFERKVPNFVFTPGPDEDPKANVKLGNIVLQTLEGKRREEEEENLRKNDQKKIKKLKDKDLPMAIEKINKANTTITFRTKLALPTPQMGDKDLELLGKLNSMDLTSNDLNPATRALLGDYSQREPTPVSMRTPRFRDALLKEAQNVIALQNVETPLIGGTNLPLNNPDFSGLTPKTKIPSTPNVLAQTLNNLNNNIPSGSQTPSRRNTDFVRNTPIHDELKLNSDDLLDRNWEISSQSQGVEKLSEEKMEKMKFLQQKQILKENLFSLPKPKNEFEITIPEIEEEDSNYSKKRELDAEEMEKIERRKKQHVYEETLKMRTLSVQKNLPRPFAINERIYSAIIENESIPMQRREIEKMISDEMVNLLGFDSIKYPYPHSKPVSFNPEPTPVNKQEIKSAEQMILEEITNIKNELKHGELDREYLEKTWEETLKNIHFDNQAKKFLDISTIDKSHRASILHNEYLLKKDIYLQENKILNGYDQKLNILLGGYGKKLNQTQQTVEEVFFEFDQKSIEKQVFLQLSSLEKLNAKIRVEEMQNYYQQMIDKEKCLQMRYERLVEQKEEEMNEINGSH